MYQLDTNIGLHYVRGDHLALQMEAIYGLLSSPTRPIVSIVTVAELQVLAREFAWGAKKQLDLENLLSHFDVIPIPFSNIVDAYIEVSDFSRRAGRAMGKNDIWIAATTICDWCNVVDNRQGF